MRASVAKIFRDMPPNPWMVLPLQSSLIAERANGCVGAANLSLPNFARATTASVRGYGPTAVLGVDSPTLLSVASGEARFVGARRISEGVWSAYDANGVFLSTTNGASALYGDASGPLGYLAEGERTNLALQSQTFASASWNEDGIVAVSEGTGVAPDGTATADTFTASATNARHSIYQTGIVLSDTTQTVSLHVKAGTNNYVYLSLQGTDIHNYVTKVYDLALGALGETQVGSTSGTFTDATITALPDSWYRITLTGKATGAGVRYLFVGLASAATGNAFAVSGDVTFNAAGTETIIVWGAQLETASFASTYIPTTTVAVTRNADVLTYPSAGNISGTQGTAYAEFKVSNLIGDARILAAVVGANDESLLSIYAVDTSQIAMYAPADSILTAATITAGTLNKVASSWSSSVRSIVANAGTISSSAKTVSSIGAALTFGVGISTTAGLQPFGTIRNLRIFPSALSSGRLQAMTTP